MKFLVQERWSPGPHIFSLCYRHGRLYDAFTCHLATAERKIHNGNVTNLFLTLTVITTVLRNSYAE